MKRREILRWTAPVITVCVLPAHAQTSAPLGPPRVSNPPIQDPRPTCEEQIRIAYERYQRVSADPSATPQEVEDALNAWIESKLCMEDEGTVA